MKQILDKVNEIAEVLNSEHGVPNVEWVKNNVNELQKVVKEKCNLPVVSPRLFYVVAASQYEEGNLEQITNGLTYERAVNYRDSDFCKDRWPNAYILASLNEG